MRMGEVVRCNFVVMDVCCLELCSSQNSCAALLPSGAQRRIKPE